MASRTRRGKRAVIAIDAYGIAYAALPKAACSSVKQALARIDPAVRLPPDASTDALIWHRIYPTARHKELIWPRYRDHWRFCVVRDPARRLMSCYADIVAGRKACEHSPNMRASKLPLQPDPDTFFQLLPRYQRRSSLVRHHALGAHVFLGPNLMQDYDRIYRTDELEALELTLSERSGRRVVMPHVNKADMALSLWDLKGATIDVIRPFLEEEYDYLSAFYTNPLGPRCHGSCATRSRSVS